MCRKFQYSSTCYGEESKAVCEEFSGQVSHDNSWGQSDRRKCGLLSMPFRYKFALME